jgi:phosphopantothenoylcysteine synthetase/decarboxylase
VSRPVLYAIVCGSPPARYVGRLVDMARAADWDACLIATPDGRNFLDTPALAAATGYPVRSTFKLPGDLDVLPDASAIIVAPATVNTLTKWSLGIADTLALGLLVEGQGRGLPIVAVPFTNTAMARHPAFLDSIDRLRRWGITVVFGEDVLKLHPPGTGEARAADFPWHLAWKALEEIYPR